MIRSGDATRASKHPLFWAIRVVHMYISSAVAMSGHSGYFEQNMFCIICFSKSWFLEITLFILNTLEDFCLCPLLQIILILSSPVNFQRLRAEITFMRSSCAQSASQNHIYNIFQLSPALNFKLLNILNTLRNDISVVFVPSQVLEDFLLMRKILESLEELGDNWRLEINPDIPPGPKFPSDLILCKKMCNIYVYAGFILFTMVPTAPV